MYAIMGLNKDNYKNFLCINPMVYLNNKIKNN